MHRHPGWCPHAAGLHIRECNVFRQQLVEQRQGVAAPDPHQADFRLGGDGIPLVQQKLEQVKITDVRVHDGIGILGDVNDPGEPCFSQLEKLRSHFFKKLPMLFIVELRIHLADIEKIALGFGVRLQQCSEAVDLYLAVD